MSISLLVSRSKSYKRLNQNMISTKRNWILIGLLIFLLGEILIYSDWIQQKPAMANLQPEQAEPGPAREAKEVIVKFNRSIILGKVERLERDFPDLKIITKIIKSQSVGDYANFVKERQVIEIQPNYFGKGFESPSFFEDKRNVTNLQGYYFLPGDYFIAEVSLWGDERTREFVYFNIQRVKEETLLKEVENLEGFLKENRSLWR